MYFGRFSSAVGDPVWVKSYSSGTTVLGYDVAVGGGNVYIAGAYFGPADFGGPANLPGTGGRDAFIAGYAAADGSHRWSKGFGSPTEPMGESGTSLTVDGTGDLIAGGIGSGAIDFGGGPGGCAALNNLLAQFKKKTKKFPPV